MTNDIISLAADVGNDSMKLDINGSEIVAPSAIATLTGNTAPKTFTTKEELNHYMANFLDHMQVSVSSPAVKHLTNRYAVGKRAVDSHLPLQIFDINSSSDKSSDDLAFILLFSLIGASAIKQTYSQTHSLPTSIERDIILTTALPISEGKKPGVIDRYKEIFTNSSHVVTFHNFADPISVRLNFKYVYVGLEGEVAQVALINAPNQYPQLAQSLYNDFITHYPNMEGVTIEEIIKAANKILIDIGGKTVDISVLSGGSVNSYMSNSLMYGFDNVLQDSVDVLQTMNRNFENSQNLSEYLRNKPSVFDMQSYKIVKGVVVDQSESLKVAITNGLSKTLGHSGFTPNLIINTGGGSIGMMNDTDLRTSLSDVTKNFNGGTSNPVLYVGDEFAQNLNMLGLKLIRDELVKKLEAGELL